MIDTNSLKRIKNCVIYYPQFIWSKKIIDTIQIMFTVNDSGKHLVCFKAKGENLEISDLFQIVISKRKGIEFSILWKQKAFRRLFQIILMSPLVRFRLWNSLRLQSGRSSDSTAGSWNESDGVNIPFWRCSPANPSNWGNRKKRDGSVCKICIQAELAFQKERENVYRVTAQRVNNSIPYWALVQVSHTI